MTRAYVYTMDDWNRDRHFSAEPGQEVTEEVYEEMQFNGAPRYIPVSLLDRYGCVRGFLTGMICADPELHCAFGETPDGRYLYLGLSKRIKGYAEGPATWLDDFYHEPKKKATPRKRDSKGRFLSNSTKTKSKAKPKTKGDQEMTRPDIYTIRGSPAVDCPRCGSPILGIHRTLSIGNPGRFVYRETCKGCGYKATIEEVASTEMMDGPFPLVWVSRSRRWGIIGYEPLTVRWDDRVIGCLCLFYADDDGMFTVYLCDDGTLLYGINDDEMDVYPVDVLQRIRCELTGRSPYVGYSQRSIGSGARTKGARR